MSKRLHLFFAVSKLQKMQYELRVSRTYDKGKKYILTY